MAVAAIAVSVLAALVVVTALRLLTGAIGDAGVRSALDVPVEDRSLVLAGSLSPGDLAPADAAFREAARRLPAAAVTRVGTTTTRGLPGRAPTDRAALADVVGIEDAATLVAGTWPQLPAAGAADGASPVPAALPEAAARALGVDVGDTVRLSDIVRADGPELRAEVVGVFRPTDPDDALWVDLPLGLTGVGEGDFTTYGPFVVAPGAFDGPLVGASSVTWRAVGDLTSLRVDEIDRVRAAVDAAAADLRRVSGLPVEPGVAASAREPSVALRGPRVQSALPTLLADAAGVGDRIRVSLLTPTVLVLLLGVVALVGAAALLATLRDGETRLLRTRGASTGRLARLALGEAAVVTGLAVVGTLVLAPAASRLLVDADTGGAAMRSPWGPADLTDPVLWSSVGVLAVLAVGVTVATTLWVGRDTTGRAGGRSRGAAVRLAAGSGLDLVLVALGVLAAVQLHRYRSTGSTTVDPVTTAAPALVVAGLAVVCLRLLPLLARVAARSGEARVGLGAAWGGWQFARRAAGQGGTLLLVLLAVAMGTIALGHSATVDRAIRDQTDFEAGAPVRVLRELGGTAGAGTGALVEQAAGGAGRVMPTWRTTVDVGDTTGVTVLAVDATSAAAVMDPRADTLDAPWRTLVDRIAAPRDLGGGLVLPGDPETVEVTARVDTGYLYAAQGFAASLRVRDARGFVSAVPVGTVTDRDRTLVASLAGRGLVPPVSVVGLSVPLPDYVYFFVPEPTFELRVSEIAVDGTTVPLADTFRDASDRLGLWWAAAPAARETVPALVTRDVARALESSGSTTATLSLGVRDLPVTVVGVLDSLPTAQEPTRGVLVDLPTVEATPERVGGGSLVRSRAVLDPQEWWADPVDPAVATGLLRREAPYGTTVVTAAELSAERLADPVNAGMRSAMLLVTVASVLLAGVGFAASTAALGRARRHEHAVLLALGMPPGRIRRVLLLERVLVVVVTVLVGTVLGVVSALTVVPLLVGGDGHPQVPPVLVRLPVPVLLGYLALLTTILVAVGAAVLRSASRDLATELRAGDVT